MTLGQSNLLLHRISGTLDYRGFADRRPGGRGGGREPRGQAQGARRARSAASATTAILVCTNTSSLSVSAMAEALMRHPGAPGRHAFFQSGQPHAAGRGHPWAGDQRGDHRCDLRPGAPHRQDRGGGQGLPRVPGQPHPAALPQRGRALPRGRRRSGDHRPGDRRLRHADGAVHPQRRGRARRRLQGGVHPRSAAYGERVRVATPCASPTRTCTSSVPRAAAASSSTTAAGCCPTRRSPSASPP